MLGNRVVLSFSTLSASRLASASEPTLPISSPAKKAYQPGMRASIILIMIATPILQSAPRMVRPSVSMISSPVLSTLRSNVTCSGKLSAVSRWDVHMIRLSVSLPSLSLRYT